MSDIRFEKNLMMVGSTGLLWKFAQELVSQVILLMSFGYGFLLYYLHLATHASFILLVPRHCFSLGILLFFHSSTNGGKAGGRDRRCYYEDGDSEDLSLSQLRNLVLLDKERKPDDPAAAADVFDFVDDEVESGHHQYKSGVKCMREGGETNTGRIGNKMKDRCVVCYLSLESMMLSSKHHTPIPIFPSPPRFRTVQ